MITKITPNSLQRNPPDIMQALAGIWGRDGDRILMGRVIMEFVYSGTVVRNDGARKAIAVLVFDDDTWDIVSVGAITSLDVGKEIKTGIIVSQE